MPNIIMSAALLILLTACSTPQPQNDKRATATAPAQHKGIQWIRDDYAAARQLAIKTKRPILIDFWAPWCHSCLSMKHTVLMDPALAELAEYFVWLSVDTDKPSNAVVVKRFPVQVWPTFIVIDGDTERLQARLLGSSTLASFMSLLEMGQRSFAQPIVEDSPESFDSTQAIILADRMATVGQVDKARQLFLTAESEITPSGVVRCDVALKAVHLEYSQGHWVRCFEKVRHQMNVATSCGTMSGVDFVRLGELCASRIGETVNVDAVKTFRIQGAQAVTRLCAEATSILAPDDLSVCLKLRRDLADKLGDQAAARSLAEAQRALLDQASAEAKSPEEVMTYNWPRVEVYTYLGIPEALVADLEANILALPDEYDPPYRLAWLLLKNERPKEALAPAERSLALVYGPRKGRVFGLVADIYLALGDRVKARQNYTSAYAIYAAMKDLRWTKVAKHYRDKMDALLQ